MIKKSPKNNKKGFRILDQQNQIKDVLIDTTTTTQKLIRDNKFIYIDINQQKGMKAMQKIQLQDSDEQGQILGNNIIINLKACSPQRNKINQYLNINRQARIKKVRMRSMVESQIHKNSRTFISIQNIEQQPPPIHKGMDSAKIWKYLQEKQLNALNKVIMEKQERLAAKFGIISQYQSIKDTCTPSHKSQEKVKQFFLPKILKKQKQKSVEKTNKK